jgi:ornithine carbamoyltransferase
VESVRRNLLSLDEVGRADLEKIMALTDRLQHLNGGRDTLLRHATFLCSFPESSLRTRVTFEIGLQKLGAVVVNVPKVLERDERLEDVAGYLSNWVSGAVIRHADYQTLQRFAQYATFPVVNAMTDDNHPCEVLTDLYTLRKLRGDLSKLKFVFVGAGTNVCRSWASAASLFGLTFVQVCPPGLEAPEIVASHSRAGAVQLAFTPDISSAMEGAHVVLTDSWPSKHRAALAPYTITAAHLARSAKDVVLWPCPPVHWGAEVSDDLIGSARFAGYSAKRHLIDVQQAVALWTQDVSL